MYDPSSITQLPNRIPILVDKVTPTTHKTVEWILHNVCNYDCTYCGEENKIGDRRWKSLDIYKMYIDKLIKATGPNPWFLITGGEPTLYPDFIELMAYLKSKGAYICLSTNGSRTLRWWNEYKEANVLDSLYVSYHTERTSDHKHIANVLNLFHDTPTKTICFITHTHKTIDLAIEAVDFLYENTASKIEIKHMNTPGNPDMYSKLNSSQLDVIKKSYIGKKLDKTQSNIPVLNQYENKISMTYDDDTVEVFNSSQELVKHGKNHYNNWMCNVSNNVLTVNVNLCRYGQMDCRVSGIVADLDVEEVSFIDEYVKCPYNSCYCSGNLFTRKYNNIDNLT
jgi:organic radical activating enzyme